jgi:anaerobic magnesium-protoporphyrin IX monomethyl ester cyclase
MPDVALVNCQGTYSHIRRAHLGLGYLKSYLGALGIACDVVDGQFAGTEPDAVAARILKRDPSVTGFSVFFTNVTATLQTVRLLREAGYRGHICLGGHYATFRYKDLLARNAGVDAIVVGEGELTFAELVGRVRQGTEWQDLRGLALRDRLNQPCMTSSRPLIADVDELPFPDRSPYGEYMRTAGIADMTSSRGCYARCGFCSVNAFYRLGEGPRWRPRNAVNVVNEMVHLAQSGARYVHIVDDNFMGPGERGRWRAMNVASEIRARHLEISFDFDCRANDVEKGAFAKLQEAGLQRVGIGLESVLPRQLKLYRKGASVEQNLRAIDVLAYLGLQYHVYFVPLEPYVTLEELLETMSAMERIGLEHILDGQILAWLVALEGTPIVEDLRRDELLYSPAEGEMDSTVTWGSPYIFRDRRVGRVLSHLLGLYFAYMDLQNPLSAMAASNNSLIQRFRADLEERLKRAKFEAMRTLLLAAQAGETQDTARTLQAAAERLAADVKRIAAAYQAGAFDSFRPAHYALGGDVLGYPPPELKNLVETIFEGLVHAEAS